MVDVCEVDVSMCKTEVGVVTYNSIIKEKKTRLKIVRKCLPCIGNI